MLTQGKHVDACINIILQNDDDDDDSDGDSADGCRFAQQRLRLAVTLFYKVIISVLCGVVHPCRLHLWPWL